MVFKIVLNWGKANGWVFQDLDAVQGTQVGMEERNETVVGWEIYLGCM